MFETIVVPLDGSSTAEVALRYAEELAGRLGSELVLIFVKEPNDYRSENIIRCYLENMAEKAGKSAERFFAESGISHLKTQTRILTGNPADEIINFAEKCPGCHLIMATHGQSGTQTRWALGGVVDKVVRAVNVPVGLMRAIGDKPAINEPVYLKEILVPLDGSRGGEAVLPVAKEMASRLKAKVTFIQIGIFDHLVTSREALRSLEEKRKSAEDYLKRVSQDFQEGGITAKWVFNDITGDVAEEINRYSKENPVDVIIMATHGHSGARRFVLGSVSNKIMLEGNTPLMLIRTPPDDNKLI